LPSSRVSERGIPAGSGCSVSVEIAYVAETDEMPGRCQACQGEFCVPTSGFWPQEDLSILIWPRRIKAWNSGSRKI